MQQDLTATATPTAPATAPKHMPAQQGVPTATKLRDEITNRLDDLRIEARRGLDTVDAAIRDKIDRLAVVTRTVNQNDAAALIVADIQRALAEPRRKLAQRAAQAGYLFNHKPVAKFGAINAKGEIQETTSEPRPLNILPHNLTVLELAALALTDAQIEAFARKAVEDLPVLGPGVDQLKAEADEFADELRELHRHRLEIKEEFGQLINATVSPLVSNSFFKFKD